MVEKFSAQLDSTEIWLDAHVAALTLSPKARELMVSIRAYVRRCRRRIAGEEVGISDLERWRRKLEGSCVALWQATRTTR